MDKMALVTEQSRFLFARYFKIWEWDLDLSHEVY
jgi:hypothetical protein